MNKLLKNVKLKEDFINWLGKDGIIFFRDLIKRYGTVLAVIPEDGIPHSVHFREGMQVRNWMRKQEGFREKGCFWFDNHWAEFTEMVLRHYRSMCIHCSSFMNGEYDICKQCEIRE